MNDPMVFIDGSAVSMSVSASDFDSLELLDGLNNLLGECRTNEILSALSEYEDALNELRRTRSLKS